MKLVLLADIHFGLKNNSDLHNQNCLDFLQFVKDWTDLNMVDQFETVFLGDWYHNRNAINVKTLNYGKEGLVTLSNIGERQYMLLGNHDLFYKDNLDVSSVIIPEEAQGIEIIQETIYDDNNKFLFVPWLVGEEKLTDVLQNYVPKYVFGHFEIPSFHYNRAIIMPGDYDPNDYCGPNRIISGHFHHREEKNNISYIGCCFSHDFGDNNDWHNKGFAILDTDTNELQYVEWKNAPKYLVKNISELTKECIETIENNTYLKLFNDIQLDNFKLEELKQGLLSNNNIKDVLIYPSQNDVINNQETKIDATKFESVDLIIANLLNKCEIENIDNKRLIDTFNQL